MPGGIQADARRWVLVLDDDPETARVVQKAAGTTLVVAVSHDLDEAVAIARDNDVAVVLARPSQPAVVDAVYVASGHTVVLLVGGDEFPSWNSRTPIAGALPKPLSTRMVRAALAQGVECFENATMESALGIESRRLERIYALRAVTAALTHDIKNPISVITGNVELGRWRIDDLKAALAVGGVDHDKANTAIAEIENGFSEMLGGVEDMLRLLSEFEQRSRPVIKESSCDFGRVVRLVLDSGPATSKLMLDGETDGPMFVHGPWTLVGQLVQCLLMSAPTIWQSDVPEKAHLEADGDYVCLELSGQGRTLSDNELAHLFDPLLQAGTDGGLGLGLPIVWRMAKDLGGKILVENEVGGTRLVLRIPSSKGPGPS